MAKKPKMVPIVSDPQSCESCRFFLKNDHDEMGYCRAGPPVFVQDEGGDMGWSHPVVTSEDWCGSFDRKTH